MQGKVVFSGSQEAMTLSICLVLRIMVCLVEENDPELLCCIDTDGVWPAVTL